MLSLVSLSPQCSRETDLAKMLGNRDTCDIEEAKDTSLLVPSRAGDHGNKSPHRPVLEPGDERRLTAREEVGVWERGGVCATPSAGRLSLGSPHAIVCMQPPPPLPSVHMLFSLHQNN